MAQYPKKFTDRARPEDLEKLEDEFLAGAERYGELVVEYTDAPPGRRQGDFAAYYKASSFNDHLKSGPKADALAVSAFEGLADDLYFARTGERRDDAWAFCLHRLVQDGLRGWKPPLSGRVADRVSAERLDKMRVAGESVEGFVVQEDPDDEETKLEQYLRDPLGYLPPGTTLSDFRREFPAETGKVKAYLDRAGPMYERSADVYLIPDLFKSMALYCRELRRKAESEPAKTKKSRRGRDPDYPAWEAKELPKVRRAVKTWINPRRKNREACEVLDHQGCTLPPGFTWTKAGTWCKAIAGKRAVTTYLTKIRRQVVAGN